VDGRIIEVQHGLPLTFGALDAYPGKNVSRLSRTDQVRAPLEDDGGYWLPGAVSDAGSGYLRGLLQGGSPR